MTLVEFLLARIAEDETLVEHPPEHDQNPRPDMRIEWAEVGAISEVLLIGEARLRAECKAKRRIVEDTAVGGMLGSYVDGVFSEHSRVLSLLALPYADHSDYREEWRP